MENNLFEERKKRIMLLVQDKQYVPMKEKEIAMIMGVEKEDRPALKAVLNALIEEGRLGISSRGKYALAEQFSMKGVYSGSRGDFGFVSVEGRDSDIYIAADCTMGAMHGDTVQVVLTRSGQGTRRDEGKVIKVLEHAVKQYVGTYQRSRKYGFVVSDNTKLGFDLFIPEGKNLDAQNGDKVVAEVTKYSDGFRNPEGVVKEVLGRASDPTVMLDALTRSYEINASFPEEVVAEAKALKASQDAACDSTFTLSRDVLAGRMDLRKETIITIDGEDAKDLDDAISLKKTEDGFQLGVHIADVSYFVKYNSALDREAVGRGTSVYMTDRVIPMLPVELSNGICSLNEGEDRLTMSCLMNFDLKGKLLTSQIAESVIRSSKRMNYTCAAKALDIQESENSDRLWEEADEELKGYRPFAPLLLQMAELSGMLRAARHARGSVDFDFPECKIRLNEKGYPVEIVPALRNRAMLLIEDFMLAANEAVAETFFWQEIPFVYRTHETPDPDKIRELSVFLSNYGYSVRMSQGEVRPGELQRVLDRVSGEPEEPMISRLVLRSMRQARYTVECTGHFALGCKYYCHFTSPIRRYPDLQIHRIIRMWLHGELDEAALEHLNLVLPDKAALCSKLERRADEVEREADKLEKILYLRKHIGEEFDGVISGVTNYGFYVELPDTTEGLVRAAMLDDDYYALEKNEYCLRGQMTKREYRLGQTIRVKILTADVYDRSVLMIPVKSRK